MTPEGNLEPEDHFEIIMAVFDDLLEKSQAQITPDLDEAMLNFRDSLRQGLGCSN
jgi:hypothetical protein